MLHKARISLSPVKPDTVSVVSGNQLQMKSYHDQYGTQYREFEVGQSPVGPCTRL